MQLGLIGLGRMGGNMARRLMAGGHQVVAYDRNPDAVEGVAKDGAAASSSLADLAARLTPPRAVWLMVPAGDPTEQAVTALAEQLQSGDTIIDGGNSHFKDDVRRAELLSPRGIHYRVGTSEALGRRARLLPDDWGPQHAAERLTPIFRTLAPAREPTRPSRGLDISKTTAHEGFLFEGPAGAGHFVKMIHNGIEYGLMPVVCRGIRHHGAATSSALPENHRYDLKLAEDRRSVAARERRELGMLDLAALALIADPRLEQFVGTVADSGEGRWTAQAARTRTSGRRPDHRRFTSVPARRDHTFAEKLLSALRAQFGAMSNLRADPSSS